MSDSRIGDIVSKLLKKGTVTTTMIAGRPSDVRKMVRDHLLTNVTVEEIHKITGQRLTPEELLGTHKLNVINERGSSQYQITLKKARGKLRR